MAQQPTRRGSATENTFYVKTRGRFILLLNTGAAEERAWQCGDRGGAAAVTAPTAPILYRATKPDHWLCCPHQGIRRSTKQNIVTPSLPLPLSFSLRALCVEHRPSAKKDMMRGWTGRHAPLTRTLTHLLLAGQRCWRLCVGRVLVYRPRRALPMPQRKEGMADCATARPHATICAHKRRGAHRKDKARAVDRGRGALARRL